MKLSKKESCVYGIYNNSNKLLYVGASKNYLDRYYTHKNDLKNGKHGNVYLQSLSNRYGLDTLEFTPLFFCSEADLFYYETMFIKLLNPCCNVVSSIKGIDMNKKYIDARFKDFKLLEKIGEIIVLNTVYSKPELLKKIKDEFPNLKPKRFKMYIDYYAKINDIEAIHSISNSERKILFQKRLDN